MRYRTGSRDKALSLMARYAIQDRESFLDAMERCNSATDIEAKKHAENCIADFKRILKATTKNCAAK